MSNDDLTIEILKSIRDETRGTRQEVTALATTLGQRFDETNARIDETNLRLDKLAQRVVESEIRTSTAIIDLAGTVREMTGVLRAASDLRPRVERCEREIDELRRRVPRG